MSAPYLPFDGTSAELERVAIDRYRHLVSFLPPDCLLFREPWGRSTVLCLDFNHCSFWLPAIQMKSQTLLEAAEYLGLANALIFRVGRKFIGLKSRSPIS